MKALLMHADRDFDVDQQLPPQADALKQDLELETIFAAMAQGDEFLLEVARRAVLLAVTTDVPTVLYRQEVLRDVLKNPSAVRELYDLAVEALTRERKEYWGLMSRHPGLILSGSIRVLEILLDVLHKVRALAEQQSAQFESRGFSMLFATLRSELADEYLATVESHLEELRFGRGVLLSAELGEGNATGKYLLRKAHGDSRGWLARLLHTAPPGYTFRLHPRDETGGRILSDMVDRGINEVANALAQSRDHVKSFFVTLRTELAFFLGCLNLHRQLSELDEPLCFPQPQAAGTRKLRYSELYDACLALTMKRRVVGNAGNGDDKSLVVVTGANTGGKSTFLRSMGLAQLMMQAGMFVAAESLRAELCEGIFTHYKREEDASMKKGKLDEELSRMNDIAEQIGPDALALFNESFAATNEREGSEIAYQVVLALLEKRVKVLFVTHQYELARRCHDNQTAALFLRAERKPDGGRTFRVLEGRPLPTSYGEDLYRQVFAAAEPANAVPIPAELDGGR